MTGFFLQSPPTLGPFAQIAEILGIKFNDPLQILRLAQQKV
jgi:hypothetical protein